MSALKNRQQKNSRGDTIVEVLLAMAVVGIVLGLSYGTANRSLATGRAAQERGEALKIAESQIELLKSAYADEPTSYTNMSNFCLIESDGVITVGDSSASNECNGVNSSSDFFRTSISDNNPSDTIDTFAITVNWERVSGGSDPEDSLTLIYRPVRATTL